MGHPPHPPTPPTPPITFRGFECGYMVQIDALSTPECQVSQVIPGGQQEGEHGVVDQVQGEQNKRKFKSLSSKRENINESKSPMRQRNPYIKGCMCICLSVCYLLVTKMLVTHLHVSHTPPCYSNTSLLVTPLDPSMLVTPLQVSHTPPC